MDPKSLSRAEAETSGKTGVVKGAQKEVQYPDSHFGVPFQTPIKTVDNPSTNQG